MKIFSLVKQWIGLQREVVRLKREIKEEKELQKFLEDELIKNGWVWDFSGMLPELVKPGRPKLLKGKSNEI